MRKGLTVLSLFDGMSCGQIALNRADFKVDKYYASEIDKYAVKVTQANYPDTVQLGDVTKWREWDINWSSIELLMGGSPCQGFSFAGKQLAFDDPRSALFFEYVNILNHIKSVNPDVKFLLENVKMKKEYLGIISELLGVEPMFINSSLVSAQNRQRYYWFNWDAPQPEDKGIVLADIIETNPENTTFMSEDFKRRNSHVLRDDLSGKAKSLSTMEYVKNGRQGDYINPATMVGRKLDADGKRNDSLDQKPVQCLEVHEHGKSRCLSTVQKDTLVSSLPVGRYPVIIQKGRGHNKGGVKAIDGKTPSLTSSRWEQNHLLGELREKSKTVRVGGKDSPPDSRQNWDNALNSKEYYRKLTPIECERLQTVLDNYTNHVSNTQRYKMLGNGWTIDVIAHILEY